MSGPGQPVPPWVSPAPRGFVVGVHRGLRGRRWPFARLYVDPTGLRVRSLGRRRRIDLAVPRIAVVGVVVGKGMWGQRLKVRDVRGVMARVSIEVPFNRRAVVTTLRSLGYPVQERHGWY